MSGIGSVKGGRGVRLRGILGTFAIDRFLPSMRRMFRFGRSYMLEALEGSFDIAGHRQITGAGIIIPSKSETTIAAGGPIGGANIHLGQCVKEMVGVCSVCIFDGEVVDDQGEMEWTSGVFPKAGSDASRNVTEGLKELAQAIVGDFASLGQAIHAFTDLNIDVVFVDKGVEFVLIHDGLW